MPMPGPSQHPTAARPIDLAALKLARASLEALALKPGQVLEAKVLGTAPNGLTQLAIAGQVLNVKLPLPLPAGTLLRLEVQPGPPQGLPVLAVQQQAVARLQPAPMPAPLPKPAATTPLPPAATPPTLAGNPTPPPAPATTPAQPQGAPMPANAPPPATAVAPAPTGANPAPLPAPAAPARAPAAPAPAAPSPAPAQQAAPGATPAAVATPATPAPVGGPASSAMPAMPPPNSAPLAVPTSGSLPTAAAMAPQQEASGQRAAAPGVASAGQVTPGARAAPPSNGPPPAAAAANMPTATAPQAPAGTRSAASSAPASGGTAQPTGVTPRAFQAAPPAPPPPGSAAQITLSQVTQAAARQDSMAPLLQNLSTLQSRMSTFPRPVMEAAMRLLGGRIVLDNGTPGGTALKQAVLRSGIFLEATARPQAGQALPQGDAKAALLQLRGALTAWLGEEVAPVPPVLRRPEPPVRGAPPRGHRADAPTLPANASPQEAGRMLLGQTEAALSRTRLLQLASLPPEAGRAAAATANAAAEWTLELPLLLGHELAMAQLQISRDAKGKGEKRERGWRLGFSLNFSALGEVGAQVSLFGRSTSVALWAEEDETAAALAEMLPELSAALSARGLEVGSVRVRTGRPPAPPPASGQLLDSVR